MGDIGHHAPDEVMEKILKNKELEDECDKWMRMYLELISSHEILQSSLFTAEARVKELEKLEQAPLCGVHAETWYCDRPTLKSDCIMCDYAQEISRLNGLLEEIENKCSTEYVSCGPVMIAVIAARRKDHS